MFYIMLFVKSTGSQNVISNQSEYFTTLNAHPLCSIEHSVFEITV
jgi:hypothetical protein